MFFRKEYLSVNFFRTNFFIGTMFRKFSFHEKICFSNFLILNYFFSKEIIFQNINFFRKKMLVANFMRFRRKRLDKQTHILFILIYIVDNFSLKQIQNGFIWLLRTFWCLSTLFKKSQKTRKTENNLTWKIPPFSSFLLGNVHTCSMHFI